MYPSGGVCVGQNQSGFFSEHYAFLYAYQSESKNLIFIYYENAKHEAIAFEQFFASDLHMTVDTESTNTETFYVNGSKGLYFDNKGIRKIIWSDDRYCYRISGSLSKFELLKIGKSIKAKK